MLCFYSLFISVTPWVEKDRLEHALGTRYQDREAQNKKPQPLSKLGLSI